MATEKRLIDANYFVNKGIRNCPIEEGGIPLGDFAKHQKILELYPTVDAVEVVHGRWLYDSGSGRYFCTACNENALSQTHADLYGVAYVEECLTDYCPNCGAKMDGDGNG